MEWHLLDYLLPFTSAFCQIVKLTLPFFYLVILPNFGLYQFAKSTLPNRQVHVATSAFWSGWFHISKATLPKWQVHVAMSAFWSGQFHISKVTLPKWQVHFTMWTARMNFQAVHKCKCFLVCPKSCPHTWNFIHLSTKLHSFIHQCENSQMISWMNNPWNLDDFNANSPKK